MANLITCDGANVGEPGDPVDLLGVGEIHGQTVVAYIELDLLEVQQVEEIGLVLEAERVFGEP